MTQKQLATTIGVATSTVNNWLKLGRSIPAEYVIPISEFLRVDCEFLLSGKPQIKSISSMSNEDIKWLELIHCLPHDVQLEFKGEIKGYLKCLNDKSVAADEPLRKTGTDSLGK